MSPGNRARRQPGHFVGLPITNIRGCYLAPTAHYSLNIAWRSERCESSPPPATIVRCRCVRHDGEKRPTQLGGLLVEGWITREWHDGAGTVSGGRGEKSSHMQCA